VTALPGKVGDELPDAVKHGLLIAGESPVIGAVELDESRLRDMDRPRPKPSAAAKPHIDQRARHADSRARRFPWQAMQTTPAARRGRDIQM
jgi:hypothetical protein